MADGARARMDPADWRPMVPAVTRRPAEIRDPVLEPLWSGIRVLAHVGPDPSRTRLIDAAGVDLAAVLVEIAELVTEAVDAEHAVLDGVITDQATRGGIGAAAITRPTSSITDVFLRQDPGVEIRRPPDADTHPDAFVAVDLLALDGSSLLDIPLLERKRLLESVVRESERVRTSVHTRPPIDPWVSTWQAAGLRGAMVKGADSRYVPGGRTVEWRTVTRVAARR
jgi:bifunctional non-homologous end joining protein LigD